MLIQGVASGTASRALALLDFWLAGPIKHTFPGANPEISDGGSGGHHAHFTFRCMRVHKTCIIQRAIDAHDWIVFIL